MVDHDLDFCAAVNSNHAVPNPADNCSTIHQFYSWSNHCQVGISSCSVLYEEYAQVLHVVVYSLLMRNG